MRLAQILHTLQNEALLCSNDYRGTLLDLLSDHRELQKVEFQHKRSGMAKSGSELDVDEVEIRNGICIIPVGGPMAVNLGEFEKGAGAVDMDDICAELEEADSNPDAESIILNFDSPGGTVTGTFETCDLVATIEKPIYAFARGKMCSGAFAIGCACDGIFATKSAILGNIGVYSTVKDLSRLADQAGIKVKVISSGPIKGIGTQGTSLTAEQEMFLQQDVMQKAKMFFELVSDRRPMIDDADMGGQFYSGEEAVTRGFADSIISGLRELEDFLSVK